MPIAMQEILSGIFHWTAFHEGIGFDVSSYYMEVSGTVIDPLLPAGGIEWFRDHRRPERVVLTCRHHYRHSNRFVEEYGVSVHCNEAGLHEFEGGPRVEGFRPGEPVAPGIEALEVNVLSPDETALRIDAEGGAIAFADGLVHWGNGRLGFVPDEFMDNPESVKRGLRAAFGRLLAEDFDSLLFTHGDPVVGNGRQALEKFLNDE
jgi:hypothetical protein